MVKIGDTVHQQYEVVRIESKGGAPRLTLRQITDDAPLNLDDMTPRKPAFTKPTEAPIIPSPSDAIQKLERAVNAIRVGNFAVAFRTLADAEFATLATSLAAWHDKHEDALIADIEVAVERLRAEGLHR